MDWKQKVVWVTGGGSGIGLAVAVEFARRGARVAVSGRRVEKLADAVAAINAAGGEGLAVRCDVTVDEDIPAAVAEVVAAFGRLDVAVANAGFSVAGRIDRLSGDDWRRQLNTNVVGAALTARHALPELVKTGGRVALVASVAAQLAYPSGGPYCASKYALRAIGQVLSLELHGTGVSCTLIHPGFVESEIARVDNQGVHDPDRADPRPAKLMWSADKAARVMVSAIGSRKREYVFTGHGRFASFMGRHVPGFMHFAMTRGAAGRNVKKLSQAE